MSEDDSRQPRHLITAKEVAKLLGLTARYVRRLPLRRVPLGHRTVRYRLADVEKFIDQVLSEQVNAGTDTKPVKMTIEEALGALKSMTDGTIQCVEDPEFRFSVNAAMRDGAFVCNEETLSALSSRIVVKCAIHPSVNKLLRPGAVVGNAKTIEALIRGLE